MRKLVLSTFFVLTTFLGFAQVKLGTNPTSVDGSAILELESTEKGFLPPRLTETERDAITSPAAGLVIYNTVASCLQINEGSPSTPNWTCISGTVETINISTNGSAIVSSYFANAACNDPSEGVIIGTLIENEQVTSVTMEIYGNVTQIGTYAFTSVLNGVSFTGSGSFTSTGCQKITLTATGTPINPGTFTWATNTAPAGSAKSPVLVSDAPNILAAILEDSDSPNGAKNADGIAVTLQQLQDLPLTNLNADYITAYQLAIQAKTNFSNPPTIEEIQGVINAVNQNFSTILGQIGTEANNININSQTTPAQLLSLTLTNTVNDDYEAAYQNYIDNNPCDFSTPATLAEVEAMVAEVNTVVDAILTQIGNEADDPNTIASVVTADQLIATGVTGVKNSYEAAYQYYIDENPGSFSAPATIADVQAMVTAVNATVDGLLAQIGNDANTSFASSVTAAELQEIGLSAAIENYDLAYQHFINNNASAFSEPATMEEVANMISAVNNTVTPILAQIGNEANDQNVPSVVTFAQLVSLGLDDLEEDYLEAYRKYIEDNPNNFSDPATIAQVQAMVDAVNGIIIPILVKIGDEANDPKPTTLSVQDLQALAISNIVPAFIDIYKEYVDANLGNAISDTATIAELQAMVNAMNLAAPTSNGTALIAGWSGVATTCDPNTQGTINGTLKEGDAVTNAEEMEIYADVSIIGTYDIEAEANGVTFAASGAFTATGCTKITLTASGTPTSAGNTTWATNTTPAGSASFQVESSYSLPADISIDGGFSYIVYSVFDNNYLPFTFPTGSASTSSSSPNSTTDPVVNKQGIIPANGVTVSVFVTVDPTSTGGTIPEYSTTFEIDAQYINNSITNRAVKLSWPQTTYSGPTTQPGCPGCPLIQVPATSFFPATLEPVDNSSDIQLIQLDINEGLGNDLMGVIVATADFPSADASPFTIRVKPGITDKNFAVQTNGQYRHLFLYQEVTGDSGRVWLNHNLGASYSNLNHPNAAPDQSATSATDSMAFGSLFQWGRLGDGHELIGYCSQDPDFPGQCIISFSPEEGGPANNVGELDAIFKGKWIVRPANWPGGMFRIANNNNGFIQEWEKFWQGSGRGGVMNPCPEGFRVPSEPELTGELEATRLTNPTTGTSRDQVMQASPLKITAGGSRIPDNNTTMLSNSQRFLWTTTNFPGSATTNVINLTGSMNPQPNMSHYGWGGTGQSFETGNSVRCIRD